MSDEWNEQKLLEVSSSFQECRILLTAAQIDLFTKLEAKPRTVRRPLCRRRLEPARAGYPDGRSGSTGTFEPFVRRALQSEFVDHRPAGERRSGFDTPFSPSQGNYVGDVVAPH